MTTYEQIKAHLEKYPAARERKNKNKFIGWLLDSTYHLTLAGISKGALGNIVTDVSTYDRAWRQVLQKEPSLRGSDYGEKDELEEEKLTELGYKEPTP
jgi:hypothetical protein